MGTLVELPANRATHRHLPSRQTEPGHSAAILFFTGVRYYRMEEAAPPARTRGPRRNRKPPMPVELQA